MPLKAKAARDKPPRRHDDRISEAGTHLDSGRGPPGAPYGQPNAIGRCVMRHNLKWMPWLLAASRGPVLQYPHQARGRSQGERDPPLHGPRHRAPVNPE